MPRLAVPLRQGTMSSAASTNPKPPRRPWMEPSLTRHESLTALTQQNYGLYPPGHPMNSPFGPYADTIITSGGFFPP